MLGPVPADPTAPEQVKWRWMAGYWAVQAPFVYAVPLVLEAEPGKLIEPEYAAYAAAAIVGLTGLQALFLAPFARPARASGEGRSLGVSMTVAGLAVAGLLGALALAVVSLVRLLDGPDLMDRDAISWAIVAGILLSWAAATPLLIAYARRGRRDDVLARVARGIFVGTCVEALALVPIDVMIRRRTSCYCGEGSYFALLIWMAVGFGVLGPFLFLVVFSRRARRPK